MKILLTGAAGFLGSAVCRALVDDGYTVRATDRLFQKDLPVPLEIADLRDPITCFQLMQGMDVLVHLANHPNIHSAPPHVVLSENVLMNTNLFEAAVSARLSRIIFASSIQTIAGPRRYKNTQPPQNSDLHYLPLDGDTPTNPVNLYGLSKILSEQILQYQTQRHPIHGVAIRLPYIVDPSIINFRWPPPYSQVYENANADDGFAWIWRSDAVALITAILRSNLTGYRTYLPAAPVPWFSIPIPQLIATIFPNVPLKKPVEQMAGLVDISQITRETGWTSHGFELLQPFLPPKS